MDQSFCNSPFVQSPKRRWYSPADLRLNPPGPLAELSFWKCSVPLPSQFLRNHIVSGLIQGLGPTVFYLVVVWTRWIRKAGLAVMHHRIELFSSNLISNGQAKAPEMRQCSKIFL